MLSGFLHCQSFNQHGQLGITEGYFFVIANGFWHPKATTLEPLVIDHYTTWFPPQQLYAVAALVDENKHSAVHYAFTQMGGDNAAEAVKSFAHIARSRVEPVAVRGSEAEHGLQVGKLQEHFNGRALG